MSMLEEKRQGYVDTLNKIKERKLNEINEKVSAFRLKLISEVDHADEQRLEEIIAAMDKIIEFENNN